MNNIRHPSAHLTDHFLPECVYVIKAAALFVHRVSMENGKVLDLDCWTRIPSTTHRSTAVLSSGCEAASFVTSADRYIRLARTGAFSTVWKRVLSAWNVLKPGKGCGYFTWYFFSKLDILTSVDGVGLAPALIVPIALQHASPVSPTPCMLNLGRLLTFED